MADVSDVMASLASLCSQITYPNGTGQPSVSGLTVAFRRGWPIPAQLDADLAKKVVNVSVYPRPDERNTSRYMTRSASIVATTPTLTATVAGQAVTIGGVVPNPFAAHNVAIVVNHKPYPYAVQPSDSLTSIATGLAAMIAADVPGTTNTGAVINIAAGAVVSAARVGTAGQGVRETRRQERTFQITIWADVPASRDAVTQPIDAALSDMKFITLADGTGGRLIYKGSPLIDDLEKAKLYRRDLLYTVEYATTIVDTQYQIVAIEQTFSANGGPVQTTYQ